MRRCATEQPQTISPQPGSQRTAATAGPSRCRILHFSTETKSLAEEPRRVASKAARVFFVDQASLFVLAHGDKDVMFPVMTAVTGAAEEMIVKIVRVS